MKNLNRKEISVAGVLILTVVRAGCYIYRIESSAKHEVTSSKIDSESAQITVSNFYRQYLEVIGKPKERVSILKAYGSNNLRFYDQYYQHGFDPLTCSQAAPKSVVTHLTSINITATFSVSPVFEGYVGTPFDVTVVHDDSGLAVDAISCPGDKAQLLPGVQI